MADTQPIDPNYLRRIEMIRDIHQSPTKVVIAVTGGGSLAISDLLTVPGGSKTVLEGSVPYTRGAIARFIARVPEQYCSPRTARQLAMAAFHRGQYHVNASRNEGGVLPLEPHYAEFDERAAAVSPASLFEKRHSEEGKIDDYIDLIGVGCTASLVTDSPKRGEYRVHIATQTLRRTTTCSLQLIKGARNRWEEERLVADLILNMIANAKEPLPVASTPTTVPTLSAPPDDDSFGQTFGLGTQDSLEIQEILPLGLKSGEKIVARRTVASPPLVDLFFGETIAVLWQQGEIRYYRLRKELPPTQQTPIYNSQAEFMQAIFPGSFNPIHEAHRQMIEIAQKRLGNRVALEIAVQTVDKPPLDYTDLQDRLAQIELMLPGQAVWLTQAKMFEEKAELFKETMFVVGADTLQRFADLRFYHQNTHALHDVLRMIAYRDCRFLVFARQSPNGMVSMRTLSIPDMLRSLCDEVPVNEFAMNISSSDIRKRE